MKNLPAILLGAGLAALDTLHASMSEPSFDWSDWKTWGRAVLVAAIGAALAKLKTPD